MNRKTLVSILVVVSLVLGFIQERTKVSLNFTIECAYYSYSWDMLDRAERSDLLTSCRQNRPSDYYNNHKRITIYENFDLRALGIIKWTLALLWIFIFWILNHHLLGLLFNRNFPSKVLHFGYLLLIGGAGLFFLVGRSLDVASGSYGVARELLGATQSIVPWVILSFGYYVFEKSGSSKHQKL